jgi:hypothetical protein
MYYSELILNGNRLDSLIRQGIIIIIIMSGVLVTIDGVRIGNWIFITLYSQLVLASNTVLSPIYTIYENSSYFFLVSLGGVRRSQLGTSVSNWPIVPAPVDR